MGKKGAKLTQQATDVCEGLLQSLSGIGDLGARKMFGGYGLFESGVMFALVNSDGEPYLRVTDLNRACFEKANAEQFGRMPYYSIPGSVLRDPGQLREWAAASVDAAHQAKKK